MVPPTYSNVSQDRKDLIIVTMSGPPGSPPAHHGSLRFILFCIVFSILPILIGTEDLSCKSIKIKNNASYFHEFENCTVIEGSLEVVLIDDAKVEDYQNLTFPMLREVTDFVLFYRATGLTSIGKLFPNLSVIRGRNLFLDYALVIYDMRQLMEIGLNNLTVIERGNVKIEKNPNLCFADTINWDIITNSRNGHKIKNNKKQMECPTCPEATCPFGNPTSGRPATPLCWNPESCQRVCDPKCRNGCVVGNPSQCCHEECLGGCSGTNSSTCAACKKISHRGHCYTRCKDIGDPEAKYEYMSRRCVTFDQCIRFEDNKIHGLKCIPECPTKDGYENDPNDKHKCKLCPKGKCPKVCPGGKIESVSQAQIFKGCSVINGSLEITVRGDQNIVAELEASLENIDTINGYLKITRSYPLITFHFLKNLRTIKGQAKDRNDYSLVVMDNPNLQELFLWNSSSKLMIEDGKAFFHINPLLCIKEIEKLLKHHGYAEIKMLKDQTKFEPYDVSQLSNGDKTACNVDDLDLRVFRKSYKMAMIDWINYKAKLDDPREVLGYLIYYKKAVGNVSMFDGRDACTDTEWFVVDYEANESVKKLTNSTADLFSPEPASREMTIITGLEPATRYAVYIKTYTIASASNGGLSQIIYFTTDPHKPQQPTDVTVTASSPGSITINWRPPKKPNGKIVSYIIEGTQDLSNIEAYRTVDHCSDKPFTSSKPIQSSSSTQSSPNDTTTSSFIKQILPTNYTVDGINCCECRKMPKNAADEADDLITFEDALHNRVYVKQISDVPMASELKRAERSKRSISSDNRFQQVTDLSTDSSSTVNNTTSNVTKKEPHRFYYEVNATAGDNTWTASNLTHFAPYSIKIMACQKRNPDESTASFLEKKCSTPNENTIRTKPKKKADDIEMVNVTVTTNGSEPVIIATWDEPKDPNGMIVTYHVEYFRASSPGSKSSRCIKRSEFVANGNSFILPHDLQSGKYSLRVKARSLASDGNWTNYRIFDVEDHGSLGIWTIVWIALAAGIFVMIFAAASTWFVFRKFHDGPPVDLHYVSMNPEYMPAYEPDEWEIPREKTKLIKELGQGSFGMVYQGELYDYDGKDIMACAIKTVNDRASAHDKIEFLQEASTMKSFDNHHVVKLLGVVSTGNPVFVCMELMAKGDLKNYLRDCRDDVTPNGGTSKQGNAPKYEKPSIKQVHLMAAQIADGMSYLAAKKFVHRDLAGRNCMVADDLTVKIGDFGMTRDIYETDYYRKGGKGLLPVRWMAPESLKDGIFTSQSDVWSFGVVLWEIVTLAQQPYQGLSNEQVLKYVLRGGVQEKPEKCPEHLFTIMTLCWNWNPKGRPTFTELVEMLFPEVEQSAAETFQQFSHYHNHVPTPVESVNDNETCPLTTNENEVQDKEDGSGDSEVKFFPSSIYGAKSSEDIPDDVKVEMVPDTNSNPTPTTNGNGISISTPINGTMKTGETNKSNEGSRESKISNGSVANGHAHHGAAKC